jgi:hypothetical protein
MKAPSRITIAACVIAAAMVSSHIAGATNGTCEELKLELPPIYEALQSRLRQHMFTRDNNLKITVEQNLDAFLKMSQLADHYDKRMVNAIRDFNDDDPEAERLCQALILGANCEAYRIYEHTVINLPGIRRDEVVAEGARRCQNARKYVGASYVPVDAGE